MPDTVISVENISKLYQLGTINTGTFRDDLQRWWAKMRGLPNPHLKIGEKDHDNRQGETVWALKDINFQIQQGEAVGIIGRNGAGKSTLLKILSRVTAPTSGEIKTKGKIASLLEVGTGFHPELTGRENIFMNGAIMGMDRREIQRKFDEIVDFSGVETYIDTPVKRYSSGMYVRLAFAVAAYLEPDILVVDEVLAVGDAEFQKKCLGKMGDVAHQGRTVLFVSHNMGAVQDLCERAICCNNGTIMESGLAKNVVSDYLNRNLQTQVERHWNDPNTAPGNESVRLLYAGIETNAKTKTGKIAIDTPLILKFRIFNYSADAQFHFNFLLYNKEGNCVFNTASSRGRHSIGIVEAVCEIPANLLNNNIYSLDFYVHYIGGSSLDQKELLIFEVHDVSREDLNWYGEWIGVVRPKLEWNIRENVQF